MRRAALFFFYDGQGIVDDYVTYMLRDLRPNLDKLYIVVNGLLTPEGREKFAPLADDIYVRENKGLDVWAYKDA